MDAEPRPRLHVTPPSGWLNDPVGGLVHGDRQHLFFQYVPSSTRWQLACHWGHLVGDDLVRWRHLPVALAPGDGDDGVWSGSAVVDERGPVLLYTSVRDGQLDLGRVALARPLDGDLVGWRKHAGKPVLEPPPDLGLAHFRDPFVWGRPGDWSMLVGAGLAGGGAVLRYTSPDLEEWRFRGRPRGRGRRPKPGGTWECPQYVDLGGSRALVVSLLARRHAGPGGRRPRPSGPRTFAPDGWETLGHGGSAYALTTYRDRAGRLAATAWLRHEDPGGPRTGWAGMLSLPVVLTARAGGGGPRRAAPRRRHPARRAAAHRDGRVDLTGDAVTGGVADLEAALPAAAELRLDTADAPVLLTATGTGLRVESGRRRPCRCRHPSRTSPCGSSWTAAWSRPGPATAGGSRCGCPTWTYGGRGWTAAGA